MSDGNGYDKIDGYPQGEYPFGSEARTELGTYFERSYGKVSSSVGSSYGGVGYSVP